MFCTQCGKQVLSEARFCSHCGAAQTPGAVPVAARRLVRPQLGRKIGGVALGFAHYFDLDVTLMRILWVVLTLLSGGVVLLVYVVAWILMPESEDGALPAKAEQPSNAEGT